MELKHHYDGHLGSNCETVEKDHFTSRSGGAQADASATADRCDACQSIGPDAVVAVDGGGSRYH